MDAPIPWHRHFGLTWEDFFHGLPIAVEMEKDLSLKQQRLDLVIVRKEAVELPRRLPDGFDDFGAHNLMTFKSYQEALDGWALNELVAPYVNYRKQVSPSFHELLPETDFRLYAVCVRSPQGLAGQVPLRRLQAGVYEARHFTGCLRAIVVHELPREEHNAMLHLYGARENLWRYGVAHYRPHSPETSTLLYQLFERYRLEGVLMPDAKEELQKLYRETVAEILAKTPPEELRQYLSPEERLKGLPPEERLKGLSVDELLAALSPDMREELARRLKGENGAAADPGGA
jgi:hypothetical protein